MILTAIRAGEIEAAASIIGSLGGDPAQEDDVWELVLSAALAGAPQAEDGHGR